MEDYNGNVILNFNKNQTVFVVPNNSVKCIPNRFDKDFTYQWSFNYSLDVSKILAAGPKFIPIDETHYIRRLGEARLDVNVNSYAQPEMNSLLVTYFIVFVAWSGLVILLIQIKRTIDPK